MIDHSEDGSCAGDDVVPTPPAVCYSEDDKKPIVDNTESLAESNIDQGVIAPSPVQSQYSMSPSQSSQKASYTNGNGMISRKTYPTNTNHQQISDLSKPLFQPLPNDPVDMYCLSLADALRAMSRAERERVKFEFANILKDAKYMDNS